MIRSGCIGLLRVAALCIAVTTGCTLSHPPSTPSDEPAALNTRHWRLVMIVFDRNPDNAHLTADIAEFRDASFSPGAVHRVVVQDSRIAEGTITFIEGGEARTLTNPDLRGCDLTAPDDLARLLQAVATSFPADKETLFLSGHGRDWTGFGYRIDQPDRTLTSPSLAHALTHRDNVPSSQVIVADGSWTATSEWLIGLSSLDLHIVCAAGEVSEAGLDYRALAVPDSPGTAETFARRIAAAVRTDRDEDGVHLTPDDVDSLPSAIQTIATAGVNYVQSARLQQELKSDLVNRGVTAGAPGISWISLGDLEELLDVERRQHPSSLDQMLLYLTDINEHGVPTGHRVDYCTNAAPSQLTPEFQALQWAPDHQQRRGFLYRLWYRQF